MAILHTVPLSPAEVAVMTMYMPEATGRPSRSQPSHVNVPPVLRPSATSTPLDVYTDCAAAIQILSGGDFADTITLHPLSDWEG